LSIDLTRMNILIVDDNASMRALVKQILLAFGVKNIHECSDGSDALQELKNFPADVVIADWMMEPVDGLDLARLIRTAPDSPNPYVPIIMLTGHTERHRVEEARDAGITEFLAKPISAQAVYHRLAQIIDKPRPFLRSKKFTGPDRRRKKADAMNEQHARRETDAQNENEPTDSDDGGQEDGLSQDEVNKLLDS